MKEKGKEGFLGFFTGGNKKEKKNKKKWAWLIIILILVKYIIH